MNNYDIRIAIALQRWGSTAFRFWRFVARYALYGFVIAGFCFASIMPFAQWLTTLALPALGCYAATLIAQLIIRRGRPSPLPEGFKLWIHTYSFPSAHAASSFACAVLLSTAAVELIPQIAAIFITALFLLAVLIALSRIIVGVHYPSDVVAGALFGSLLAALAALAIR